MYEVNEAFLKEVLKDRINLCIRKTTSLCETFGITDPVLKANLKNIIGDEFRELEKSLAIYQSARGAKTIS